MKLIKILTDAAITPAGRESAAIELAESLLKLTGAKPARSAGDPCGVYEEYRR